MRRAPNPWDRFYRFHAAPWRGERPVASLRPFLGEGPVLELGCGNGKLLRPLLRERVGVVGLDVSWHALRRLDHDRLVLGDAARLPFGEGAFSAVLDIHCGGHLDAAGRQALAEASARIVRPGGHVVVERLAPGDLRASQGASVAGDPEARRVADGRTTWFADQASLRSLYEGVGLECVQVRTQERRQRLRASHAMRSWVRGVFRRAG